MITNIDDEAAVAGPSKATPTLPRRFTRRSVINCTNEHLINMKWLPEFETENKVKILNMLCINEVDYQRCYYRRKEVVSGCYIYNECSIENFRPGNENVQEFLKIIPYLTDEEKKKKEEIFKKRLERNMRRNAKFDQLLQSGENKTLANIRVAMNEVIKGEETVSEDEEVQLIKLEVFPMDARYVHGKINIFELKANRVITYEDARLSLLNHQPSEIIEDIRSYKQATIIEEKVDPQIQLTEATVSDSKTEPELLCDLPMCLCCPRKQECDPNFIDTVANANLTDNRIDPNLSDSLTDSNHMDSTDDTNYELVDMDIESGDDLVDKPVENNQELQLNDNSTGNILKQCMKISIDMRKFNFDEDVIMKLVETDTKKTE